MIKTKYFFVTYKADNRIGNCSFMVSAKTWNIFYKPFLQLELTKKNIMKRYNFSNCIITNFIEITQKQYKEFNEVADGEN